MTSIVLHDRQPSPSCLSSRRAVVDQQRCALVTGHVVTWPVFDNRVPGATRAAEPIKSSGTMRLTAAQNRPVAAGSTDVTDRLKRWPTSHLCQDDASPIGRLVPWFGDLRQALSAERMPPGLNRRPAIPAPIGGAMMKSQTCASAAGLAAMPMMAGPSERAGLTETPVTLIPTI